MKSEQERIKRLLRDELDKDTEKIIEEVEVDESLKNLVLPEDMDAGLQAKIKQYEANQAVYENLSDGDKEALRLGREQQILRAKDGSDDDDGNGGGSGNGVASGTKENSDEKKVVKFSKRRRMAFGLVAIVAVLVMGFGMTSIGGKPFIPQLFEQMLAGRENVNIDTDNEDKLISDEIEEDEAYQKIKNEFGFDAVELWYLPEGTEFIESVVDLDIQEAHLLFEYNKNIIEYRILINYTNKSFGYDMEDVLVEEYTIWVSETPVAIKQYKIVGNDVNQFMAQFYYKNANYVLRGQLDKAEFEKILNNLKFF